MAAETFGPYRIEELLGRGGMGEVHRAYDTVHDRVVALKRLSAQFNDDADYRARFRTESRIVARLREPHVIPIHAYGEIDGHLYLDMRLVEGRDLTDLIGSPMEPARAVRIVEQVASALDAAHTDGLVHRDVKPSNILVAAGDFVYLVDFGIARSSSPTATHLTASGAVVGTLDYMAPERFGSGPVDGRVDVYALACVLFTSVTGRRPFTGDTTAAQIWAHMQEPPPRASPLNPDVPPALDEVIVKGMAKDPEHRYPTAGALAAAAAAALDPAPQAPTVSAGPRPTLPMQPPVATPPHGQQQFQPLAGTPPHGQPPLPQQFQPTAATPPRGQPRPVVTPPRGQPRPQVGTPPQGQPQQGQPWPAATPPRGQPQGSPVPSVPLGPPAKAGPPSRARAGVITAVGVVAVVAVVVVSVLVLKNWQGGQAGGQSPSESTPASALTTTTEPSTSSSPPPPPNPSVVALQAVLPEAYNGSTTCAEKPNGGGTELATVACTSENLWSPRFPPPDLTVFRLFPDRAAQDAYFTKLVQENNIPRLDEQGGCRPTSAPTHYAALVRSEAGPLPGEFTTCFVKDGAGQIWWVDSKTLVIGQAIAAKATTPDALENLDSWWNLTILSSM
jgi:serine/threonine-protein kinase